jgi:hypothetical protein
LKRTRTEGNRIHVYHQETPSSAYISAGVGVTLGLPLVDSMVPAQTPINKTAASPARRFGGIWHPHGAAPGYWSPQQEGKNFDFSFITKPLEPFRDHVTLISGLDMPEAMATE